MKISWFGKAASAAAMVAFSCSAWAHQADFNGVGKQMAIMLQNSHVARMEFNNVELSHRFLVDYLKDLDPQRLYFTQEDVDGFGAKFGDRIPTMLLREQCMVPAREIHQVLRKRVGERVALAERLLTGPDFDYSKDESFLPSRKDVRWSRNPQDADAVLTLQLKSEVLAETLRRQESVKLSKEQGKPEPSVNRTPKEKVLLGYRRTLKTVNGVDDEEIASRFLSAVARAFDPHSDYLMSREMELFNEEMRNELVGVGAEFESDEDGSMRVTGMVVGGPADRGNALKLNDRVVAVDRGNSGKPGDMVDITFMPLDQVLGFIHGGDGTQLGLRVKPAGGAPGETQTIVVQRGKVKLKNEQATGDIIEIKSRDHAPQRLGWITLPSFYDDFDEEKVQSSVDVERILKRLIEEKIDGLVLDLRQNGGGSVEQVRRMTGFFMDHGPVVQMKNNRGQVQVSESDRGKALYLGPMVVVVDKASASASEIMAGALQDFNRAVIVGDQSTFGKGTVQQPLDIGRWLPLFAVRNRAGYLKVTYQRFYRPSGTSTQLDGVEPQVVMPSVLDGMETGERTLDHHLPHDRISPASGFVALDPAPLFVSKLREKSQERVSRNQDFQYIIEDALEEKARLKANRISLNLGVREMEREEGDARNDKRNAERKLRFATLAAEDAKNLKFYQITMDGLDSNLPLPSYVPSDSNQEFIRRAKSEAQELDQTPPWPTHLDPLKRESLYILRDLVELTESATLVGASH